MLESIYIGMSGLAGYSQGLRVIANNTANLNTPGFKSSSTQFSDLFYSNGNSGGSTGNATGNRTVQVGYGLGAPHTTLNFKQGELRQTGNNLDLAIDGQGLFTLKDSDDQLHYTRAGQFQFDIDGVLVNNRGDKVMALGSGASATTLSEINLTNLRTHAGGATTTIKFSGNLSSTGTEQTVEGVKVFDAVGGEHTLTAKFTNTSATTANSWSVKLLDGAATVGSGQIIFDDGLPTAASAKVNMNYTPAGQSALPLTLDFSANVTSFATGDLSTVAMASQDGYASGSLTQAGFDSSGALVLTYSNGQKTKGARLALGRTDSLDALEAIGGNQFDVVDQRAWRTGHADDGVFGSISSGVVEISNVDLSQEFSDLVVMQRGYQASSQMISTANEMLQQLFSMVGK